jgi:hypothetical protein
MRSTTTAPFVPRRWTGYVRCAYRDVIDDLSLRKMGKAHFLIQFESALYPSFCWIHYAAHPQLDNAPNDKRVCRYRYANVTMPLGRLHRWTRYL